MESGTLNYKRSKNEQRGQNPKHHQQSFQSDVKRPSREIYTIPSWLQRTQGPDVVADDLRLEDKHQKGQGQVPAGHIGWSVDSYGWGPMGALIKMDLDLRGAKDQDVQALNA